MPVPADAQLLLDVALLVQRIVAGGFMLPHGLAKLLGWFGGPGLAGFASELQAFDLPSSAPVALLLAVLQTTLGALVLLGAWTRLSALLAMAFIAVTATLSVSAGWFWNHHGAEYPLFWAAILFALMLTGGGRFALDVHIIRRYRLPGYEDPCCD
ncbi:DoxX family protein [Pseudoxanthomonas dokdonensis]|uniref:Membrane protein n=1 Tax=Pseudoxanthomonas dokdonensis TaxID=344882 RepID=A0A0R0CMQ3_9GAMM|nr:DoxX family protein [Pseudoxanthomonas dokdonensis]KRG70694.1 membrane protein [Pseudoxanthomonas dokdonensis]